MGVVLKASRYWERVTGLQSFPTFCAYLAIVVMASVWQKNTKPMHLRPVLVVYNFVCSSISLFTFVGFVYTLWAAPNIFQMKYDTNIVPFLWAYWITKHIELLDTIFMILRHRQRQVSFLHVFHHSSMLLISDYGYHLYPWTPHAFVLGLNSLVHVALYFYYGLTAYNPNQAPAWKQRLTELQLLQFSMDLVFALHGYVYYGYCIWSFLYGLSMTVLFSNFYYKAYIWPKAVKHVANGTTKSRSE